MISVDDLLRVPLDNRPISEGGWGRLAPDERPARATRPAATPSHGDGTAPADLVATLQPHWGEAGEDGINRRYKTRALAGFLAKEGWRDDQILAVVDALPTDQLGARRALALETAKQARSGAVTAGLDALVEWIGAEDAEAVRASVTAPRVAWLERMAGRMAPSGRAGAAVVGAGTRVRPAGLGDFPGEITDWAEPAEPIDYICRGLALAPSDDKVTIIGGSPGHGKGPLVGYLVTCFASGRPVFGQFPVRQHRTALLDFEGARLSRLRIESYARGLGLDGVPSDALVHARMNPSALLGVLSNPEDNWLLDWAEREQIESLWVDSYTSAAGPLGLDPNKIEFASLAQALAMLGRLGVCVGVVAHARKPLAADKGARPDLGDVAGSYALGGYAATGVSVWKPDPEDHYRVNLGCMRAPEEPFGQIDLRWVVEKNRWGLKSWRPEVISQGSKAAAASEAQAVTLTRACNAILRTLRLQDEGGLAYGKAEIAKRVGESDTTVLRGLELLQQAGHIYSNGRGYTVSGAAPAVVVVGVEVGETGLKVTEPSDEGAPPPRVRPGRAAMGRQLPDTPRKIYGPS